MLELVLSAYDLQNINDVLNYAINQVESSNSDIQVLSNTEYDQLDVMKVLNYRIEEEFRATTFAHRRLIEDILDVSLSDCGFKLIEHDWKAFYDNPQDYKDSVVVDMVVQYLRDIQ